MRTFSRERARVTPSPAPTAPPRAPKSSGSPLGALDLAMAVSLALEIAGSVIAAWLARGWISAAVLDAVVSGFLLVLGLRARWRPIVWRLLALMLTAGVLELATDAAGERVARSLLYPPAEPSLWLSPAYMPLSWMIVLAQLGYLAWRVDGITGSRLPRVVAMGVLAVAGALDIPFYEQMAYAAGWWRYRPTSLMVGHTPLYVVLFEALLAVALPWLVWRLPRLSWRHVLARGVLLGGWIACAAGVAWLALGR